MATLKEAAQARAKQPTPPEQQVKLNHPTLDSPAAAQRLPYNPAPPEKRFVFLKRFSTVPGLRAKSQAAAAQM